MTDTHLRSIVNFEVDPAGQPVAGNIERWFDPGSGRPQYPVRAVLSAGDLAGLLPSQGDLVAQVQALNGQLAAANATQAAAETARDQALSEKAAAIADKDAALAAKATAEGQRDQALADKAAALTAQATAESAKATADAAKAAADTARDQALTEKASAISAEAAAVAARDQAVSDKAAALADKATAEAARDVALARVAELEAQIAPVDGNGFPVLSAVQVRLGLLQAGITASQINAIIEAIPDPVQRETAHTYWDYATQYHRDHQLVAAFAGALSLTTEQVDTMWRAAAQIV